MDKGKGGERDPQTFGGHWPSTTKPWSLSVPLNATGMLMRTIATFSKMNFPKAPGYYPLAHAPSEGWTAPYRSLPRAFSSSALNNSSYWVFNHFLLQQGGILGWTCLILLGSCFLPLIGFAY